MGLKQLSTAKLRARYQSTLSKALVVRPDQACLPGVSFKNLAANGPSAVTSSGLMLLSACTPRQDASVSERIWNSLGHSDRHYG